MANLVNVQKSKQFIIFNFDDGKNVKYDLATKTCIGKRGKKVQSLQSQLAGVTVREVIRLFDDTNYSRFLNYVYDRCSSRVCNIATVLNEVPHYSKYEQLFSAGITNVANYFSYSMKDIPKGLLKLCREYNFLLNNALVENYTKNHNIFNFALNEDFTSITPNDVYEMVNYRCWIEGANRYDNAFNVLINTYNYDMKSLFGYIDYLMTYEGITYASHILRELCDYASMAHSMSNKFDKYPRNFLTVHTITSRNYNRLKKQYEEEKFASRIDKSMEKTFGSYKFIYPDTTQDIKDEAVAQSNCVASYIPKVIEGGCHILFMRDKEDTDTSLVTIEVRNNKIVQALQRHNARLTKSQQDAVDAWNNWRKQYVMKKERGSMAA